MLYQVRVVQEDLFLPVEGLGPNHVGELLKEAEPLP